MAATKQEVDNLFDELQGYDDDKKTAAASFKLAIDTFADEHELTPKAIAAAYKNWKEVQRDLAKFSLLDHEADTLLLTAVPELAGDGGTP